MSTEKHVVVERGGVSIHRVVPVKRSSSDFNVDDMSAETKEAWRRVCGKSETVPAQEDYQRVFESLVGRKMVNSILK
ncbi:hypothetical protein [Maridesulfovibrio sp. FT414]|uniref:hypothetical protein n=1 Tax=Maridesulfovibrio sp. FT414 TaxID=2979469 RepID=UPI003D809D76